MKLEGMELGTGLKRPSSPLRSHLIIRQGRWVGQGGRIGRADWTRWTEKTNVGDALNSRLNLPSSSKFQDTECHGCLGDSG